MSKIYTDTSAFEKAQEEEFRNKVEEIAYYQGDVERTTIDGEWTEEELKDDVWNEAHKLLNGTNGEKGLTELYSGRALINKELIKVDYLVEYICNKYDLIEIYNKAYDMHRNDKPRLFGIHYFDELARGEIKKVLKDNLASK